MKKWKAALIILCLSLALAGTLCAAAGEAVPEKAVVINEAGEEEELTGEEEILSRLNIRTVEEKMEDKAGYESFMALAAVFPKDASRVYLTLKMEGVVPGDEVLVYENGEETQGRVTGVNEITFYFTESGTIEIYRKAVKEELEEEPEGEETETETEVQAPVTGESDLPETAGILFFLFAAMAGISAGKAAGIKE